jgi:hypothetical protein
MCVLCWQFLTEDHGTERWVDDEASTATETAGNDQERTRRRVRHHRTGVPNRLLGQYGLRLDDWQSRSYMLSDRKGKTVLVATS